MRVVEVELDHDVLVVGAGVPMKSEHTHTSHAMKRYLAAENANIMHTNGRFMERQLT